ncbi:condensation domain-containing protein [Kribbella solani]|uniref:Condensation domain-containing protein n=1 Tax=Kribbella solani TaxID=236067 RepID=A0A841DJL1_9ACTN|nr:condensation domain-containing protein [Kribbella solani]MBB5977789.1 hypothetical protein [Kribbella solani]
MSLSLSLPCDTWCQRVTPQQERRLIHQQADLDKLGRHRPFYSATIFRYQSPLDRDRLQSALAELVRHHEALRYVFHSHDGEWFVTSVPEVEVDVFELVPDAPLDDPDDSWLQNYADFGPGRPDHIAAGVVDIGAGSAIVLLADHLVIDAQSWSLLLADLGSLYRGDGGDLGPVDTSARDALDKVRTAYQKATIPASWQPVVEEMSRTTPFGWVDLPTLVGFDTPKSDATKVARAIDLTDAGLEQVCHAMRRTRFSLLLAAVYGAISRTVPGEPSFLYVYPSFREGLRLGNAMGWFTGQALLRVSEEDSPERRWAAAQADSIGASINRWAVTERINEVVDVSRRFAARPSLSVGMDTGGRDLDLGLPQSEVASAERVGVQTRGRIAVEFTQERDQLECAVSYEPVRFAAETVELLVQEIVDELLILVRLPEREQVAP